MDDGLAARLAELNRKIDLVQAQLSELYDRFESTGILGALAVHEEVIRLVKQAEEAKDDYESRQLDGEEDLVGL